jgi:hypothetical protein
MSKARVLALIGAAVVSCAVALSAQTFSPPKTPWGHPDLQGIYSNDDETGTPMERPAQFEGKTLADITPEELQKIITLRNEQFVEGVSGTEFAGGLRPPAHLIFDTFERKNSRAWLVVDPPDGRIPRRTDAAPRRRTGGVSTNANPRGPFNSWLDMGLYDRCITRGIPNSMMPAGYGSRYDITQSPDSVVIRYEMIHEARVIPLDGRAHAAPSVQTHFGDSRGYWDGNSLVVETTNIHPDMRVYGAPGPNVRVVERFTRIAANKVEWTVTIDDSTTWLRPWTYSYPMTINESKPIFEYACHEGNFGMANLLSAGRLADKQGGFGTDKK